MKRTILNLILIFLQKKIKSKYPFVSLWILIIGLIGIRDSHASEIKWSESLNTTNLHKGKLIIISGPSGTGKTSIITALKTKDPNLCASISATTRNKRPEEEDGKNYYFISEEAFAQSVKEDKFATYRRIYGHMYGTYKSTIDDLLAKNKGVIFDVNYTGRRNLAAAYPNDTIGIFISPPSVEELRNRLTNRGESSDSIDERMSAAQEEISHCKEYDHILINQDLTNTVNAIHNIINEKTS